MKILTNPVQISLIPSFYLLSPLTHHSLSISSLSFPRSLFLYFYFFLVFFYIFCYFFFSLDFFINAKTCCLYWVRQLYCFLSLSLSLSLSLFIDIFISLSHLIFIINFKINFFLVNNILLLNWWVELFSTDQFSIALLFDTLNDLTEYNIIYSKTRL